MKIRTENNISDPDFPKFVTNNYSMPFKPVSSQVDFVALEQEIIEWWAKEDIVEKYLHKNDDSSSRFSFLDGPITANNPMGVHHAWGRTYKDVYQRYHTMLGDKQRYQNGFDEQGLWVEVEVEKELQLHSKKDILNLVPDNEFASLEKFITLCKERVTKYSAVQTEQSQRLGYFMDWDNSYHTSSPENNYAIWHFINVCNQKGWLYKGHDSVPWCPRCGTAISQMEMLTEDYKEVSHESVYFKLRLEDGGRRASDGVKENGENLESLLVWTTTPWTIPANVAVAVHPEFEYVLVESEKGTVWITKEANQRLKLGEVLRTVKGSDLVGRKYAGPFDQLEAVVSAKNENADTFHSVVPAKDLVVEGEGTGLVHIAPGAGSEDFKLSKTENLPVIAPIDESAVYVNGFDFLTGQNAKKHPELIIDYLKNQDDGSFLFKTERYKHRYPICWRCKTELVWRVVDEWYIAVDKKDDSGKTYREQMVETAQSIHWLPKWGLDREMDWLKNLGDWLISKKRFWGLALPIYEDTDGSFITVGSLDELKQLAVEGWPDFEGHTPHRPWIDQVKIKSPKTGSVLTRIPDVGNPWLDAGIVPFSTMTEDWFPADFITESFPGQFKNWFYALIAMSTVLKSERKEVAPYRPFKTVLGFATVRDEKGQEMHKSKGNSIEFNAAAEQVGAESMRWQYVTANPENNLNFGFGPAKEVQRRFFLIWWNVYNFFVTYANLDGWEPQQASSTKRQVSSNVLDRWIMTQLINLVENSKAELGKYNAMASSRLLEDFIVKDLSQWYLRRSRDRVGPTSVNSKDRNDFYSTMYECLMTVCGLGSPYLPFLTDAMYRNLSGRSSVHLSSWPNLDEASWKESFDSHLDWKMGIARQIAEKLHAEREKSGIKLKRPILQAKYYGDEAIDDEIIEVVLAETNIKSLIHEKESGLSVQGQSEIKIEFDMTETQELLDEQSAREIIRSIQAERKKLGVKLDDRVIVTLPAWPESQDAEIKRQTLADEIIKAEQLSVALASS